jgi:hypothetical protein
MARPNVFDEPSREAMLARLRSFWGVFVHKHFDHHLRQFGA